MEVKNKQFKIIYQIFVGILLIALVIMGIYISKHYYLNISYSSYTQHHLDLEMNYWKCKSSIIDAVEGYMKKKVSDHNLSAIIMLNSCDKYNIDVRLPMSQGFIESHYGTKGLARSTNSVFGVGAFDGDPLNKILGIYKYKHPNQSIEPYLALLRNSYLKNLKTEQHLLDNFITLNGTRYASYDKYEQELQLVWNDINLNTELDSLLDVYHSLKVELGR